MIKGFGGVFWRTNNLEAVKKWYSEVLQLDIGEWNGTVIRPQAGNETVFFIFFRGRPLFSGKSAGNAEL